MNDEQIMLVYKGAMAGRGDSYDSYQSCLLTAIYVYYDMLAEIVVEAVEDAYQGSTMGILQGYSEDDGRKYYWFNYGWGSCSGCDLLQGSGPLETIKSLRRSIVPVPTEKASITQYIENELQNSWDKELVQQALDKWKKYQRENNVGDNGEWKRW